MSRTGGIPWLDAVTAAGSVLGVATSWLVLRQMMSRDAVAGADGTPAVVGSSLDRLIVWGALGIGGLLLVTAIMGAGDGK